MKHGTPCWLALGFFLAMFGGLELRAAADLCPRPPVIKPIHTTVDERHQLRLITVKFQDGLHIRVRDERLTDFGTGELGSARLLLDSLGDAKWLRVDSLPEDQIEQMRQVAQTNLGCAIADLNLQFHLRLPPGTNLAEVIDAFNALDIVELAQPTPRPGQLFAPDLQPLQGYLLPPTNGINAFAMWTNCGARGAGIKLAAIGCSFNTNHVDLPTVPVLDGDFGFGDEFCEDHGTATLGVIGAKDNGNGTTGIAPDCSMCYVGVMTLVDPEFEGYEMNIPGAVMTAIGALTAGDVIYFEMGIDSVAIDWDKPVYDRVVLATGLGITVVEPGGNGQQNLDSPFYSTGHGGHWPFLPSQDSGAIIVGAGSPPPAFGGITTERSRLTFSTYGSTVDLQGWGSVVATTGPAHGLIYNAEGNNNSFGYFAGTSSAGPVVAGACVLLQSAYKARTSSVLTPAQVKQVLQLTGSPQQAGQHPVSENIGPLPNVKAATDNLFPPVIVYSRDHNTVTVTWKACCILQVTDHLGPHADWANVPTTENTYTYTHGPGPNPPSKFFRLFCP